MGANDETLEDLQKDFGQLKTEAEKNNFEQEVEALAKLSDTEYELKRKDKANELKCRVSFLDKYVHAFKSKDEKESDSIGSEIENSIAPYSEAVDGAEIAKPILELVEAHLFIEHHLAVATSLWVIGTYCFDAFSIFPRLLITSPKKRCGKSTLVSLLNALVSKSLPSSNISPSAIFRIIEKWQPTLLMDEADTFINSNEELRGILNSSHRKDTAFIVRSEGNSKTKDFEPKIFKTWSPIAISMIKEPEDTIKDRSITISLKRRTHSDKIKKMSKNIFGDMKILRQKLRRWADDNFAVLEKLEPNIPQTDNDRLADNWFPLFAIAELLGGDWLREANEAFQHFNHSRAPDDSIDIVLLEDIKLIFNELNSDKIHSKTLVEKLCEMEARPWAEWRHGKPLSTNSLSNLLKPFGVSSRQVKINGVNKNGYLLDDFQDVFLRYLPNTPLQNSTSLPPLYRNESGEIQNSTDKAKVEFQNDPKPLQEKEGREVEFQKGGIEKKTYFDPVSSQNREEHLI